MGLNSTRQSVFKYFSLYFCSSSLRRGLIKHFRQKHFEPKVAESRWDGVHILVIALLKKMIFPELIHTMMVKVPLYDCSIPPIGLGAVNTAGQTSRLFFYPPQNALLGFMLSRGDQCIPPAHFTSHRSKISMLIHGCVREPAIPGNC